MVCSGEYPRNLLLFVTRRVNSIIGRVEIGSMDLDGFKNKNK